MHPPHHPAGSGDVRRGDARRTRPATRPRPALGYLLLGLLLVQGVSGIAGGSGLTSDPTGRTLGLDPMWLEGSPFGSYRVPGLVLLTLLGVGPLLTAWGVVRRLPWSWAASLLIGLALVGWIVVQVLLIGYTPWPPLQLVFGLVGAAIVLATTSWSVRSDLRRTH